MDYEKKYKEALERAKKFIEENPLVQNLNTWIKETFPELKESEDEKIRKWLISQLKIKSDDTNSDLNIMINKAITWLEKQGDKDKFIEKELGCIKGYRENAIKRLEELEKQGEQKQLKDYSTLEITDVVRQALQECESFSNIRADLYAARVGATVEDLIKKQSEQKPTWSKEDEKEYKYVLKFVDNILNNCGNKKDYEHCKRCYDWLKSLKIRYTWKPSDEQMAALKFVIESLDNMFTAIGYMDNYTKPLLEEILEALKKLREE